jgi:hypothetical protein
MIDREHELSIVKQAEVVGIARSTVYYLPRPVSAADLDLMNRIDRLHAEFPFAGARMLRGLLAADGRRVGRRHVKTLMRRMGIEALYRHPRTTKPEPRRASWSAPSPSCGSRMVWTPRPPGSRSSRRDYKRETFILAAINLVNCMATAKRSGSGS